jgi:hypothetical protein
VGKYSYGKRLKNTPARSPDILKANDDHDRRQFFGLPGPVIPCWRLIGKSGCALGNRHNLGFRFLIEVL